MLPIRSLQTVNNLEIKIMNSKRIFDLFVAAIALVLLSPLFVLISIFILFDSKGGVFSRQVRVGLNMEDFHLYKFRTTYVHPDDQSLLTTGRRDHRITKVGGFLRRYKLDELPQLLNILRGNMSFVGPRPEVRKYVNLYTDEQIKVLSVKPGITDWAFIAFCNESKLLEGVEDPENYYIEKIIPEKIKQNMRYIHHNNMLCDFKILCLTINRIVIN